MSPTLAQIDAFTDRPFSGNPAAVCLLDEQVDDGWMRALAAELNLSETAFALPLDDDPAVPAWQLRWFTPTVEVELCGHATLATAHLLFDTTALAQADELCFATLSGELIARRLANGWIELDFPADHTVEIAPAPELLLALGLTADQVVSVHQGRTDQLVEVVSAEVVRSVEPDHALLRTLPVRGVMVTAVGDGLYDIVSRFFAPGSGIDEDPVTGSAHCTLGPYWSPKLGKPDLLAHQASSRGGMIRVGVRGERVLLAGRAVTTMHLQLTDAALPSKPKASSRPSRARAALGR